MVIIITYDLRTPKDYHDFFEAIKAQGEAGKWWHYMSSTWLLSTTKTPQEITDAIATHLESQDSLFVCELTPNYQGRLPKAAWDWITSELNTSPLAKLYGGHDLTQCLLHPYLVIRLHRNFQRRGHSLVITHSLVSLTNLKVLPTYSKDSIPKSQENGDRYGLQFQVLEVWCPEKRVGRLLSKHRKPRMQSGRSVSMQTWSNC